MYDGFYDEHGLEKDLVILNMSDLTGGSLIKIYDIVKEDAEGEENLHSAKRINSFLKDELGL
jgi:hypothetical protein